jgi:FkbM family methyltransferase
MPSIIHRTFRKIKYKIHQLNRLATQDFPTHGWVEKMSFGLNWRLNMCNQIDREIACGVYEVATTKLVTKIVKPGMKILDIGGNIGYYTLLMGKLIGNHGKMWVFEPVDSYRQQNKWHIENNQFTDKITLFDFAISDAEGTEVIAVDNTSATMHYNNLLPSSNERKEQIKLDTLDNVCEKFALPPIDFIKIDTDGHEPQILNGAQKFFAQQKPIILIEFAQLALDAAGSDVRKLKDSLESLGYTLFSEQTLLPFASRSEFLLECGNFTHSANVWAVPANTVKSLAELF